MSDFTDPVIAARTRDALGRHMLKILDAERPDYQYGTVESIDPDQRTVHVVFPGQDDSVPVKVGALLPTAVGQTVRVSGRRGDRFISDILGVAITTQPVSGDIASPTSFALDGGIRQVTGHWNAVDGAFKYRLQLADDSGFTVNARQYDTISLAFTESGLNAGDVIYGKVQVLTDSGVGTFSAPDTATVEDFPVQPNTDGAAPTSSPNPFCRAGIGYVLAEWLPISNADIVSYEVHVSLTTGFTVSSLTYLGETTGSHFFVTHLADGTALSYGVNVFVKLVAKDADGSASSSAQAFAAPIQVNTGDVGTIDGDQVHDGAAPSSSPDAPTVTSGVGYLYVQWDHIVNVDPVTYEVHLSSTTGFTPTSATLIGETPSNRFFARTVGPGAGGGALVYGTTYYVKIRAKDADGSANAGTQGSGFTVQANTADIAVGAITAASAIIADAAIGSAKIIDASITTAKIADASISSAKIQNLAVDTAQIANAAIATAKIGDAQVTNAKINDLAVSKLTAGTITAQEIVLSNSTSSILRSSNFSAGSAGWRIRGNGDAEFNDVTVRGTLVTSTLTVDSSGVRFATTGASVGYAITWGYSGTFSTAPSIYASGSDIVLATASGAGKVYAIGSNGFDSNGTITQGGVAVSLSGHTHAYYGSGDSASLNSLTITGAGTALTVNNNATISGGLSAGSATIGMGTTASAANVFVTSGGVLQKSTSSAWAKSQVQDMLHPEDLLKLKARRWKSRLHKGDMGGYDDPNAWYFGAVAEEAKAANEMFATYDDDGKPNGINWPAIVMASVERIKNLETRVQVLEGTNYGNRQSGHI